MSTPATPLPLPSVQYMEDRRWIKENIDALVRDHPNQWIAVHRGKLLAAGPDLGIVADKAERQSSAPDIVFQFIDDGSLIF
jgi:hypothetical protein